MGRSRKLFTEEEELHIKRVYRESESKEIAQELLSIHYGKSKRTIRRWFKSLNLTGDNISISDKILNTARKKEISKKISIFSWAQISTPAHRGFIRNMEAYANFLDADIGIIAGRYTNPTSIFSREDEDNWWDQAVIPHLTVNRHKVHEYAMVMADVKIQPTATVPVNYFEGVGGETSLILGHPRVQLKVVPSLEGYRKKAIFTTGACTVENYTDSRAGKKGEFHHMLGFVIVENDGDEVHMRHVTADDEGNFMDLNYAIKNGAVRYDDNIVELYACGDKHFGETDWDMENAGRAMMGLLKPKYVRLDDIFNGHSVNPHESKHPIQKYHRVKKREHRLDMELLALGNNLQWYDDQNFKVIIPQCNHDIFLDRYIDSQDWKKDIINSRKYMDAAIALMDGKAPKGLIAYYINTWYPDMITLGPDESFIIKGWEQSVHGHRGANGSRGSVAQFRKLSTKMITNHTHSPSRYEGVVTGGTNTLLRVGYNQGASNWMHADTIIHSNGKAQQLLFRNYKCTTLI